MRLAGLSALVAVLALIGAATLAHAPAAAPAAHAADGQQCADPFSARRDPSNPLALRTPPGSDPLNGASFFVPGPAHGAAAGAIAQLVGLNPKTLPDDESWASFSAQLSSGSLADRLKADPSLKQQVDELSKIAAEPEVQRISSFSQGGGPGAIFAQTQKILCHSLTADPGSIPIFNTYFLHAGLGGCPTPAKVRAYDPIFHRRVNELAAAAARRPVLFLLELDAIGSSKCISKHHSMPEWEADLRYEMRALESLPHTVVYVEGGYSDGNSVSYTAKILNAIHVNTIRGFYTNDTHLNWTINEVRWATKISKLTHGAHFIVNTAENGHGPLRNKHPSTQGVEDLCNPPGRGLGPRNTTDTGFPDADAFLWTHPPGNSSGCGGGPPGGTFWTQRGVQLAQDANGQLGPGLPSLPY